MINDIAWKFGTYGFDLQNNLFQTTYSNGTTISADLLALNINRGRDHGYKNYLLKLFFIVIILKLLYFLYLFRFAAIC